MTPTIGVMMGDRHGIGPEITARFLAEPDLDRLGKIVLFGDPAVLEFGQRVANVSKAAVSRFVSKSRPSEGAGEARVSSTAGSEVLDTWKQMIQAAQRGEIDAILYAPVNKEAMHLGGLRENDDLEFFCAQLDFKGYTNWIYVLEPMWMSRITGHASIRDVPDLITKENVLQSIQLLDRTIAPAKKTKPKIAVAGLNPHAGDGGLYGDEEIKSIAPAIADARQLGIDVDGPFPPDSVFVRAQAHSYDGVVTMYHDQGGIAMKLLGFGKGVALMGGLPFPVVTPGHGTAYDIAGRGIAQSLGVKQTFQIACRLAGGSKVSVSLR
jgi:4-hydroxythreonine-4-phosphate dehydrogenase